MASQEILSFYNYEVWLTSKVAEFSKQGYSNVTIHDLWKYLTTYRWKKGHPDYYYEIVNDIMSVTPNQYFNYETIKAQVYDVKSIDKYDLSKLL